MTRADEIGQLVKLAGRRQMPEPSRMSAARAAAHAEWARCVQRGRRTFAWWALASAAVLVIALGLATWRTVPEPAASTSQEAVATLQTTTVPIVVTAGDGRRATVGPGDRLHVGDRIETSDRNRAAISFDDGVSARLDLATTAIFDATDRLRLERGAVYVETGEASRGSGLRVETPFGSVRHLGTQFEVRLLDRSLRVRVREGTVAVEHGDARWTSRAREQLLFVPGQAPLRQAIATSGTDWSWVSELPRPFHLEGATVPRFLDWVSREQGLRWEYGDSVTRDRVETIVLHGSVERLTPSEALEAVLPTCGLTSRLDRDRLIVSLLGTERR
jgi:FecR protein